MSVLILTPTLTGEDGLSCLARQFVDAFASFEGDGVHVLSLANASSGHFRRAPHVVVYDARGSRPEFVWRAWQVARGRSVPTLTVVLHAHLLPAAWPIVRRGSVLLPVLVGLEAWRPLPWTQRRMLLQASRAIAISHHTAREFVRANSDFSSLRIDVCWPATPPPAPETAPSSQTRPFALIVGRMFAEERYKGHDALIDVWHDVASAVPGARLVIAGTGDDELRLRQRVSYDGLSDHIAFAGPLSAGALAALYRDCAFFVMPSRHEGFGFVFLEAMRAGRACIGGRGAAEEIIQDSTTGVIVNPGDRREIRDAVVRLFQHPELCARFGEEGRRRARDVFSIERFRHELAENVAGLVPHAAAAC